MWLKNRDHRNAALVLLPSILLVAVFVYMFMAQTVQTSLTDWGKDPTQALSLNPVTRFIGLDNYKELFTGLIDARFRQDLVSMIFFTVFFIVLCLALGLGLAMLLDRSVRGEGLFRTIFLFPMSLSFIVTGTIWRWMLQPEGGINQLPTIFGAPAGTFGWLTSRESILNFDWNLIPTFTALVVAASLIWLGLRSIRGQRGHAFIAWGCALLLVLWASFGPKPELLPYPELHGFNLALLGVLIAAVWQLAGYTMALYLAGLRGIPEELREAARVDGASEWQLYLRIMLPLLRPVTLSAIIVLGHISLKIFDLVFAMAGPDNVTTDMPALLMYLTAFRANQFAKGAAIGVILLILVALVIVPYLNSQLRREVRR